jgi:hypothetical protein
MKTLRMILLLAMLLPLQALAAVAYVTSSSGVDTSASDAQVETGSLDTTAVSDAVVVACMSYRQNAAQTVTGMTHAGNAMTQIGSTIADGGGAIACFYRVGSANGVVQGTVSATPTNLQIGAIVLSGANQATPIGTPVTGQASGVDAAATNTGAATSAVGGLVVDGLFIRGNPASIAVVDAGQTEREAEAAAGSVAFRMSTEDGAASVTMGWTWTNNNRWGHMVIPVSAAAASSGLLLRRRR